MSDPYRGRAGDAFMSSAVGTSAGVSTTQAGASDGTVTIEHISGSSDGAGVVTVESPSGTVIWTQRFNAAYTFFYNFPPGCLRGAYGAGVLVKLSASTSHSEANIGGYIT